MCFLYLFSKRLAWEQKISCLCHLSSIGFMKIQIFTTYIFSIDQVSAFTEKILQLTLKQKKI
ncbi:hypothetical protein LCGC14_1660580 [marine sediment metagenome]|uniref:Uncharacterized protein n=1 Tax=marine sediment metagenome TaxID=412755 RepID=A0A0F9HU75_9ZZZZ